MAMTPAQFEMLKTSMRAAFITGLAQTPDDWKKVAGYVSSGSRSNTYAWLTQFPAFREWVGARQHKKTAEKAYQVVNKKFENTVDIERVDIEDDNLGHYSTIAQAHGQSVKDLMNDLIFQALGGGFTSQCYDDQMFFDAEHPVAENPDGTGAIGLVSNMQDGANAPWILLCTKRAPKALYLQERVKPEFTFTTTTDNPQVFELDSYPAGGRWRGNAAYGFWQCAFGSKADLTADNFASAYDAMMDFKGDGGSKLGIVPDTMVVGVSNRVAAEKLLLRERLETNESNIDYKRVELVVTPWLA